MNNRTRLIVVVLFAIAMAWVESAVVFYLRTMFDRIEPYQPHPFPISLGIGVAEIVRELSTMIMLFTVGWLAGKTWRQRAAYSLIAFGVWDIFYYVWLKVLTGWPHSLLNWDALFLIPLPWWGPVLAPVLISMLMIWWGALVLRERSAAVPAASSGGVSPLVGTPGGTPGELAGVDACATSIRPLGHSGWKAWALSLTGVVLALYMFMTDAIRVVRHGGGDLALRDVLPARFNWPLFLVALVLMSAPIFSLVRRLRQFDFQSRAKTEVGQSLLATSQKT